MDYRDIKVNQSAGQYQFSVYGERYNVGDYATAQRIIDEKLDSGGASVNETLSLMLHGKPIKISAYGTHGDRLKVVVEGPDHTVEQDYSISKL